MGEEFDYEAVRRRFPGHWDTQGWPVRNSTWQSVNFLQLRVRVLRAEQQDVEAFIFWDGTLEELRGLFAYESDERWNLDRHGLVYGPRGIGRDRRWRDEGEELVVAFRREYFGGPDTWHKNFGDRTPFFEPIKDWDER